MCLGFTNFRAPSAAQKQKNYHRNLISNQFVAGFYPQYRKWVLAHCGWGDVCDEVQTGQQIQVSCLRYKENNHLLWASEC